MSITLIILIVMSVGAFALFIGILIAASARDGGTKRHPVRAETDSLLDDEKPTRDKEARRRTTGHLIALFGAILNLSAVLSLLFQTAWPHIREWF